MGDRFILALNCAYCGQKNEDVYYAESSGFTTFRCGVCFKVNRIEMNFRSRKMRQPKVKGGSE